MVPQDTSSIVNWTNGLMEFKWWWNARIWSNDRADRVSSTYLFQNNGLWVQVDSVLSSTSSMTRSATVTVTGNPIAVPKVCWYHSPLYDRYVALGQKVSRFTSHLGRGLCALASMGLSGGVPLPLSLPNLSALWWIAMQHQRRPGSLQEGGLDLQ